MMIDRRPMPPAEKACLTTDLASAETIRRVPLSFILGNDREIVIEFNGADYHLRITRNEKLILTK
jgi:hemin uptake protein HemP